MPLREVNAGDERALQDIADSLAKSHKHLLVTGAGISTSCGIPVRQASPIVRLADMLAGLQVERWTLQRDPRPSYPAAYTACLQPVDSLLSEA